LINLYAGRDSAIHRANPYSKLFYLFVVVFLDTVLQRFDMLVLLYLITISIYLAARIPVGVLLKIYLIPFFAVFSIAFLFIFSVGGSVLWRTSVLGYTVSLTDGGIMFFVTLLLRALISVTYTLAVIMSTRFSDWAHIVSKVFPRPLDVILILAYRYVFVLADEMSNILTAARLRGGFKQRASYVLFTRAIAVGMLHTFDRGERLSKAMQTRNFKGKLYFMSDARFTWGTGIAVLVGVWLCVYAYFFKGISLLEVVHGI
jgi:cobalt ECF transporter T component CbiQ